MAKTKTVEYTLSLDDLATGVYNKFVAAVESGEVDITKAIKSTSGAFDQHGKSINNVTGWIKDQRSELRMQNFAFHETEKAIGAVALGLTAFGAVGSENTKRVTTAASEGLVTFQGLNFALGALPYGTVIAGFAGIAAGVLGLGSNTKGTTEAIRSHKQAIDALLTAYDEWEGKFKGVTATAGTFTKAQIDLTSKNAEILRGQINEYRRYLDEVENGEKIQIKQFGMTTETRKTGLETLGEINRKYLQESQTFQTAYNNAITEGKSKEDAKTAALKAAKEELQGLIDKQNAYVAVLGTTTSTASYAAGSLDALTAKEKELEAAFSAATNDDSRTKLRKQIDEIKIAINEMTTPPKSTYVFTLGYELQKSFQAGHEAVQQMQDSMKTLFGDTGKDHASKITFAIDSDIKGKEELFKTQREIVDSWEQTTLESLQIQQAAFDEGSAAWAEFEKRITRVHDVAAKARAKLSRDEFGNIAAMALQAYNLLGKFGAQANQADIINIENKRDAALAAIDDQLAAENLSEDQKKKLTADRAALVKKFDDQERQAKTAGFEADKSAAIINSIIQTAVAVVKALPDFPLAIAVGILGAAETALIAGQPTPRFHQGTPGPMLFDASPSKEMGIIIRGGETFDVRTEQQRSQGGSVVNNYFSFNGPIADELAFKRIIENGMRLIGVTDVTHYFRNNRSSVILR